MKKAVVVWDIMLDKYVFGTINRLNPEEHAVTLLAAEKEEYRLWWAANVAANLVSMWIQTKLVGVLWQDEAWSKIYELTKILGIELHAVLHENPTIIKERFMSGDRLILRVDREKYNQLSDEQIDHIYGLTTNKESDIVIFSDYGKWMANTDLVQQLKSYTSSHDIPMIADSKPKNINMFHGITIIKPNFLEFKWLVWRMDMEPIDIDLIETYGLQKARELQSTLLITRWAYWASIISPTWEIHHLPAIQTLSVDPTWAWDSFLAWLAYWISQKMPLATAVKLGMKAWSIAVSRAWTTIVGENEII